MEPPQDKRFTLFQTNFQSIGEELREEEERGSSSRRFSDDLAAAATKDELAALTVADLKRRLGDRGLSVSGRKTELVERLWGFHHGP